MVKVYNREYVRQRLIAIHRKRSSSRRICPADYLEHWEWLSDMVLITQIKFTQDPLSNIKCSKQLLATSILANSLNFAANKYLAREIQYIRLSGYSDLR